jgi:hypothetical protein
VADSYDARPLEVIYDLAVKGEVMRLAGVARRELGLIELGDADHRLVGRLNNALRALDNAKALLAPPAADEVAQAVAS